MTRTAHQPQRATRPITAAEVDNRRRYRCSYTPRDALGHLNPSDTGAAPFVQFLAANAEQALDIAQQVTGCPVIDATRIEAEDVARVQAHHTTSSRAAPGYVATRSARVDIWIRTTGRRRQAFYRCPAVGVSTWQAMGVPLADKALKAGSISLPGIAEATVEAYTEEAPTHPMAVEFAECARALNGEIDALNLNARGEV